MKRIIGVAVAGVIAFSGVYALAASLNVTSNTLGAGVSTVASCQASAVLVTYPATDIVYQAGAPGPGYVVEGATVTGVLTACYSANAQVTLYGTSGAALASSPVTSTGTSGSFNVTFASPYASANAVINVAVVIGG
jgi:hypothetical protein